ncbi:hypothetical protein LTS18_012423, partial [Coniosporium uncinatum]
MSRFIQLTDLIERNLPSTPPKNPRKLLRRVSTWRTDTAATSDNASNANATATKATRASQPIASAQSFPLSLTDLVVQLRGARVDGLELSKVGVEDADN